MGKRKFLLIIGSLLISVVALIIVYLSLILTDVVTISQADLVVETGSAYKEYDGKVLTESSYKIKKGVLAEGHSIEITYTGHQILAGQAQNTAEIKVFNEGGREVTNSYNITVIPGNLTVGKRKIDIQSGTDSKVYDGTPLTCEIYNIVEGSLVEGDKYIVTTKTSLTDAMAIANLFGVQIVNKEGVSQDNNYQINYLNGTLTVNKKPITVKTATDEKEYDGKPLTNSNFEIAESTPLVTGQTLKCVMKASITNIGVENNIVDSFKVIGYDLITGEEIDYSTNYSIEVEPGTLTVHKRPLSVESASDAKYYDGKPLSNPGFNEFPETPLPENHELEALVIGSALYPQTEVKNTIVNIKVYKIINEEKKEDVTYNFDIFKVEGILKVYGDINEPLDPEETLDIAKITSDFGGVVYLRSKSYGNFDGTSFSETIPVFKGVYEINPIYLAAQTLKEKGAEVHEIYIELANKSTEYLYPYYAYNAPSFSGNDYDLQIFHEGSYTLNYIDYFYNPIYDKTDLYASFEEQYCDFAYKNYTEIPSELKNLINIFLIANALSFKQPIAEINNYLCENYNIIDSSEVSFDKNDPESLLKMLNEGDTRMLAIITTILYRYHNIPARFVEGYRCETIANTEKEVTTDDIHYWVEVYLKGMGWIVVDPASGKLMEILPEPPQHEHTPCSICGKCVDKNCDGTLFDRCLGHEEHEHTECPECGLCVAEECDGTEEEKCSGHPIHEHIPCDECGLCVDKNCDGTTTEKCPGHEPVHEHTPCEKCNLCIDPSCDGEESEKCPGHPIHEHVPCDECGLCIDEDCDGYFFEKCSGHDKHEHIPCQTCGLCVAEDCDGEESDKCQGHYYHEHVACEECGLCVDKNCDGEESDKCQGHEPIADVIAKITSTIDGLMYLRDKSYGNFSGTTFIETVPNYTGIYETNPVYLAALALKANGYSEEEVIIELKNSYSEYLYPYYATNAPKYTLNDYDLKISHSGSYSLKFINYFHNPVNNYTNPTYKTFESKYSQFVYENYLQIPEEVKGYISLFLKANNLNFEQPLSEINNYLCNNYEIKNINNSISTGSDLEYYISILKQGDIETLAVITTILYRYYGIPARFVQGYLCQTVSEEEVEVTENDAHFWTEVYINGFGWIIIDPSTKNEMSLIPPKTHEHTSCDKCGKCTDEDCDGYDWEKCLGHLEHEHTPCRICGLCISKDCDGEDSKKCQGHEEHEHIACDECGLCIDVNCDGEESGKCKGHYNEGGTNMNFQDDGTLSSGTDGGSAGNQGDSDEVVFKFTADGNEYIYFKQKSFGDYAGTKWLQAPEFDFTSYSINPFYLASKILEDNGYVADEISISILAKKMTYLIPYFTTNYTKFGTDATIDSVKDRDYTLNYIEYDILTDGIIEAISNNSLEKAYREFVYNNYLSIPESTKQIIDYYLALEGITSETDNLISRVVEYVRNIGKYEPKTYPDYVTDNVAYFLEVAKKGICQQFASTGTLMFRALGIPARYTIGFVSQADNGNEVDVTPNQYHAWIEIYIDGLGWVIVDTTGSSDLPSPVPPKQHEHTPCPECGLCLNPECDGEDSDKCPGHEEHEHIACLECGLCIDKNCTGTDEEKCPGHEPEPEHEHTPCPECGLCLNPECDGTEEEKCPGHEEEIKEDLVISPVLTRKKQDGTPLTPTQEIVFPSDFNLEDYSYECVISGSLNTLGYGYSTIESFTLYDKDGNDITDKYNIIKNNGRLHLYKSELRIKTLGFTKTYDGKALKHEYYELISGLLGSDNIVDCVFTKSITDVGSVANIMTFKVKNSYGSDITSHYWIRPQYGVLTVTPKEITITIGSAEKEYDGEALICHEYSYTGVLLSGHKIKIEYADSITEIGICDNTAESIDIVDDYNNSYLKNYKITIIDGILKVKPKSN